jgi:hypothetical protein
LELPLGEEREAYAVDVLSGGDIVRNYQTETPSLLYPTADELADFGAPQSSISIRVAQLSATVGAGFPAESTLIP